MIIARRFNGGLTVRAGLQGKPFQRFTPMNNGITFFLVWLFPSTRNDYPRAKNPEHSWQKIATGKLSLSQTLF
ncbi:hypothetical protein Calab_0509 [Caldithrix abyssi DSM 13497]|uniref:Uncharacterized protein n=1 Tax=Caldithrix abyssi DSM 13497 TaxID=880073 RepID=H1XRK1_CALAY|nr:hypothetical protein [Caldithrix abyssi]APF20081.1 hypothetical protein Cabys_3333 [Caldithrix abyssi DSM 13497]EHO40154.1 hypothetical protein Calab_0509 [Caldithrix abyssi DSM 13497]